MRLTSLILTLYKNKNEMVKVYKTYILISSRNRLAISVWLLYLSLISLSLLSKYFFAVLRWSDEFILETLRKLFFYFGSGLDGSTRLLSLSPNVDGGFGPLNLGTDGYLIDTTDTFLDYYRLWDEGLFRIGAFSALAGFLALCTL